MKLLKYILPSVAVGLFVAFGAHALSVSLPSSVKKGDLLVGSSTNSSLYNLSTSSQGSVLWVNSNGLPGWAPTSTIIVSSNGNVGIGTTTVNSRLSVQGNIFITSTTTSASPQLTYYDPSGNDTFGFLNSNPAGLITSVGFFAPAISKPASFILFDGPAVTNYNNSMDLGIDDYNVGQADITLVGTGPNPNFIIYGGGGVVGTPTSGGGAVGIGNFSGTQKPTADLDVESSDTALSILKAIGYNGIGLTVASKATSTSGYVGIGTTTPHDLLVLQGSSGTSNNILTVASASGASLLNIKSNGYFGFGTTNPVLKYSFQLGSPISTTTAVLISDQGVDYNSASIFPQNGVQPLLSVSKNSSAIGDALFAVGSGEQGDQFVIRDQTITTFSYGVQTNQLQMGGGNYTSTQMGARGVGNYIDWQDGSSNEVFHTFSTNNNFLWTNAIGGQVMTLLYNGQLGINSSTPGTTLAVKAKATIDPLDVASSSGASILHVTSGSKVGINTTTPTQALVVAGTIQQSAIVSCSTGLTTDASGNINGCAVSDERLKTKIIKLGTHSYVLWGIQPISYYFKAGEDKDSQQHIGFTAQNVQQYLPQCAVSGGNGYLGVDSNCMAAELWLQAQYAKVENDWQWLVIVLLGTAVLFLQFQIYKLKR